MEQIIKIHKVALTENDIEDIKTALQFFAYMMVPTSPAKKQYQDNCRAILQKFQS